MIGCYHGITVENENGQNFQFGGLPQSHLQKNVRHALLMDPQGFLALAPTKSLA